MACFQFATLIAILIFALILFSFLLKEKAIAHENTMRFSALVVAVILILILSFVPMSNETVVSALVGLLGTIFGYFIRDIAKDSAQTSQSTKTGS